MPIFSQIEQGGFSPLVSVRCPFMQIRVRFIYMVCTKTEPNQKLKFFVDSFDFFTEISNIFPFSSDVRLALALLSEAKLRILANHAH
jgi:hypothetical protein